jgi:hypothetical protein
MVKYFVTKQSIEYAVFPIVTNTATFHCRIKNFFSMGLYLVTM